MLAIDVRDRLKRKFRGCGKCYALFQENVAIFLDGDTEMTDDQAFAVLLYLAVVHERH